MIIDVGHSYAGLCNLVGGRYFTYSLETPICFNPFLVQEQLDTEEKESLKNLLIAIWKRDNETYSQTEYVALSSAVTRYFSHLAENDGVTPSFNSFYEFIRDHFAPSLAGEGIRDKHFDVQNFLYVLKPFYKGGEYDFLLNATENMNLLSERFMVFEIDSIKNNEVLFKITTIIIMQVFLSKIRKLPGRRKIILIEEAWKAIAKNSMAEYIKYLWKTIRKYYGEPVVVTQELGDIIGSSVVKDAIVNNSDCKILMDQTKYINKFNEIQELLGLTDKDKTLILSMNKSNDPTKRYKEVFINLGGIVSKVYRTEVSLEEYLTYTTEEKEKMLVQQYAKKYGSLRKGIAVLAADLRDKTVSFSTQQRITS